MSILKEGVRRFFIKQPFTVVSTITTDGSLHNSCKGIVHIDEKDKVYLMDVYKAHTYENLVHNPKISITAVDEHKFIGYSMNGEAKIINKKDVPPLILRSWDEKINKRISGRLLKNLKGERGHALHPEALLPKPEYLIAVDIKEVIDLTPKHIKEIG